MYLTKQKDRPYYYVVFEQAGKRTKKSTKCKYKSDALKFLSEFEKNFYKQKIEKIVTLSDFETEYREYIKNKLTISSQSSVKLCFSMLTKAIGNPQLRKIDVKTIDKFITSTFNRSESTAALNYRTLKAAFNKALQWNYITSNPFSKIKAPKVEKKLPVFISDNEFKQILEATEKQFLRDLFITAYNTGMRAGELVNLKWNAVNFEQGIITVKNTATFKTKSGIERIIPINEILKKVLNSRFPKVIDINQDEYVFYRIKGIRLEVDYISKRFKKICRKLKFNESYHFHTIRHTFASNLVQRGVDLYTVKELLGHSNITTTQIYSHLKRSNLVSAVDKLSKISII